ncbi:MAG: Txe/YoeB family addiction module toxin [Lentimicrobiaceae bacterium]|nr:Txe/YoeB family addiction module toxin [Lentimicrobiaceae bacterium]
MGVRYDVTILQKAKEDILFYKSAGNKIALARIDRIIEELALHPEFGIGKPKKLKNDKEERWARRIDDKNRMTYQIKETEVIVNVLTARGHYDDK